MTKEPVLNSEFLVHHGSICNTSVCGIRDIVDRLELDSASDSDLIERSTAILDELDDSRAALLATRARAFRRKGVFDLAAKEASKVIEVRPIAVEGYLVLSEVYAMQGKHQLAVSVLEEGLFSVLPSDWPLLYEKREASIQSLETKVDFVRILPSEISARILISIGDDDALISCTHVSKYWRSSLLQYPELWKTAEFDLDYCNSTASLLQSVSTFVKTLAFYSSTNTKEYNSIIELASNSMLSRVEKLITETYFFSERREHRLSVGALLGRQLTKLVLCTVDRGDEDQHSSSPSLGSILIQCPNLKHLYLDFTYSQANSITFGSSDISGPLKLESLYSSFRDNDDAAIIEQLIPQCPSLLYLHTRSTESRLLSLLDQHCPELEQLYMWPVFCFSPPENSESDRHGSGGLKKIYCEISNASQMHSLAPFLVKSKDSLEVLRLQFTQSSLTTVISDYSHALPDIEYDHLKEFHFYIQRFDDSISKIIRQCTVLDSILLNVAGTIPDNFFVSLTQLTHLRRLVIETVQSCVGLEQFFAYHSARGQGSTLEGVQVQGCNAIEDEVLNALAGVTTLKTIIIRGRFPSTTPGGMSDFVRKLGANANLKFLYMQDVFLTNDSAQELENTVGLKVRYTPDDNLNSYELGDVYDDCFDYY